jgi:hypothetical protein
MRKLLVAFVALAVMAIPSMAWAAGAGGVTDGAAFYVDGVEYRTVGTPTDLSRTKAPAHTFDTLYAIDGQALAVSEAAPGDTDYNGGRWRVHAISFDDYHAAVAMFDANGSGDFDSAEEVEAAIAHGAATDNGVVASFVCPVIRL